MLVRMLRPRVMQDAGQEVPLEVDRTYDLPDVVAQSFIATGAAEAVGRAIAAPEQKPFVPPETKARRTA